MVEIKQSNLADAMGFAYSEPCYLQGRSGLAFYDIFSYFPLEDWYKMYSLHEVSDEALWDRTIGKYA